MFAWTVTTDDLRASFTVGDYEVDHGLTPAAQALQRELAAEWNGPVQRPDWWWSWKQTKSGLTTYRFSKPSQPVAGLLCLAMTRREPRGMMLVVHDLWAADREAAAAIYGFLGGHHSRAEIVHFRRGALPPYPTLLHGLRRYRLTAEAWHPWMLRILDIGQALRLRGWPADLRFTTTIGVEGSVPHAGSGYQLRVTDGQAEVDVVDSEPIVVFSSGQLAVWYAGGYATAAAARLSGVRSTSVEALATLLRATGHLEPWLPDLF